MDLRIFRSPFPRREMSGTIDGTRFLPADEKKITAVGGESRIFPECTFRDVLVEDGVHKKRRGKERGKERNFPSGGDCSFTYHLGHLHPVFRHFGLARRANSRPNIADKVSSVSGDLASSIRGERSSKKA